MNNYIKAKAIKEMNFEFEEFSLGGRNEDEQEYINFKLNLLLDYFCPHYYKGDDVVMFFRVGEEVHANTGDCISKEEFIESDLEHCRLLYPSTSALTRALDERDEIERIKCYLEKDSTIEELLKTGQIDPEFIPEDLELLVIALEEVTGLEYHISSDGQYVERYI